MSIIGTRVVREEDPRFLRGEGTFIANLRLDDALHCTFVRSTMARAALLGVDVTAAASAPGVVAAFTAADLDLAPAPPPLPMFDGGMLRPYLATGEVRFVGDLVAMIVSDTPAAGADAASLVEVGYDPRPVVMEMGTSLAGERLHDAAKGNLVFALPDTPAPDAFDGCEVVVELTIENQRVAPVPMEVRSAAAVWDGARLTHWACSQGAHDVRDHLAKVLGLDAAAVRVITPDVGGGFGAKSGTYPEEMLVAWAARRLGRAVRWTETRTESMLGLGHGRAQRQQARMGGTRDGRVLAYRLDVLQDSGAYPGYGAVLPFMTKLMTTGVYDIARAEFASQSVATNTTPVEAFRGAGRPEATAAVERTIDAFAHACGLDPAEVRRRNFLAPSRFPLTTAMGAAYDSGAYEAALDRALAAAGYAELRAEQSRRRAAGDVVQLGIGLSAYVEVTNPMGGGEYSSVEITPAGGAIVRTGSSSHGQGHHTAWAMIVSDATGIPLHLIEFRFGDTDDVPRGGGTGGSKSLQLGGSAARRAAELVVDAARRRAADLLEADPDDVRLDTERGVFHVAGSAAPARSWTELAAAGGDPLAAEFDFKPEGATFPFGVHVCVVEVDTDTGAVRVRRHIACDDAGTIVNPLLVDGQVHGGIAAGIAQALTEEVRYDADGNPITSNLADYAMISAAELPSFERVPMETPTPRNPLGAKGIGEAGTIGATPAVQNAVVDALAHLGVRHVDMPCTAERVWRAIRAAQ